MPFLDRAVGIDLGTTNSEIAWLPPSEQQLVIYADRYYGAKGAVVNDMGGSLEDNQQYQRAVRSCG